jgi:hypothetical protein
MIELRINKLYTPSDEIGGACSTNAGEEVYIEDIGGKVRR